MVGPPRAPLSRCAVLQRRDCTLRLFGCCQAVHLLVGEPLGEKACGRFKVLRLVRTFEQLGSVHRSHAR
eukprot:1969840-Pyramimonas_sp.AAC.1